MFQSLFLYALAALGAPSPRGIRATFDERQLAPTVNLDDATFTGTSVGIVNKFLGIPFAESTAPPNRFKLPIPVGPYTGTHSATSFGPSCPQQSTPSLDSFGILPQSTLDALGSIITQLSGPTSEDCLTVNVMMPSTAKAGDNLPVVAWIYGGGFEAGGTSTYDATAVISKSIALGQPIIYVSMNYRVAAWGFLASQEVKDAGVGNLGLQDQRLALKWIQKYVSAFGGDPTKVTLWGESAGAISATFQMLTNGGNPEGLFRGAFMQSGSPTPVSDITHGQGDYDTLVQNAGCARSTDTLECLRNVDEATLQTAVDRSQSIFSTRSLNLAWQPRADGVFLTDNPWNLIQQGSVANIPFVTGDNDDEGTLFSLTLLNITTDAQTKAYLTSNYLPSANASIIEAVGNAYPDDITQGSPFNTGILNAPTPEYKRLAAFQGDLAFQSPRRFFLSGTSGKQDTWSFLNVRLKPTPILGTFHASDLVQTYGIGEMQDYLINFINSLDPNIGASHLSWPKYTTDAPNMLTFLDGLIPLVITQDTFRKDAIDLLIQLSLEFPL